MFGPVVPHLIISALPDSYWMQVNKLEVTSGKTHTVYFNRTIRADDQATIHGEIDGVCKFVTGPFEYTVDEKRQKIWSIAFWTDKENCQPLKPGNYVLRTCWKFPVFTLWNKKICKNASFSRY